MQAIYFDMDETIANLAGVPNWLEKLRAEDASPYAEAAPIYNMVELNNLLNRFVALGVTIGVITWSAMNGSKEYNKTVRNVKKQWVKENLPCVTEFHCVKYGTPKHTTAKIRDAVLVDDNAEVRAAWKNGNSIDATKNILNSLREMLAQLETM